MEELTMLEDSLKLMEYRVKRLQDRKDKLHAIHQELQEIKMIDEAYSNALKNRNLLDIKKDYPDLYRAYKQGKIDYSTLLKLYEELEYRKLDLD